MVLGNPMVDCKVITALSGTVPAVGEEISSCGREEASLESSKSKEMDAAASQDFNPSQKQFSLGLHHLCHFSVLGTCYH